MKHLLYATALLLFSCGGNLSDEQRRQIREGIEMQKIVKVSDSEITAEAMDLGKAVFDELQKKNFTANLDSLQKQYKVIIRLIAPGTGNARLVEQELIDAYVNGLAGDKIPENIQKIWIDEKKADYDSLLYTRPQVINRTDGVEELKGIWSIYMSRKDVVLSISKRK